MPQEDVLSLLPAALLLSNYQFDEKYREFCQIKKYFCHTPPKNIFIKSAGVFWIWPKFFSILGLTRPGKAGNSG